MYKLIGFDMDGTLTPSKSAIGADMIVLLQKIIQYYHIAIISGGDFPQFQKQLLAYLHRDKEEYSKLLILPASGTKFYRYDGKQFVNLYEDPIDTHDKEAIIATITALYDTSGYKPDNIYGDIIEDRSTQITFSALGQESSLQKKESRDPTKKKRQTLIDSITPLFPDYNFALGGNTSIDITKRGRDKSYGIYKIMEVLAIEKKDIAFVGDKLEPGGNDYPIKAMGIDSRETSGPEQTKMIIQEQFISHT